MLEQFLIIDFPALLIVCMIGILCALMGSFLILQKQAVLVDAIAHSILPGIVLAVLFSGTFSILYIMSGAVISSLLTIFCVFFLQTYFKIEQGAAIGAVFTTMFALGIILLETTLGSKVHLDTQHVLYGALDLSYWPPPHSLATLPDDIKTLFILLLAVISLIILHFKEIQLTIFDPAYARLLGMKTRAIMIGQMIITALVAVTAFQAVGSILVISLFICPAACARLLTNSLKSQLWLSAIIGLFCAITGYILAAYIPYILDLNNSLNAAAMISTTAGFCLWMTIAIVFLKNNRYFKPIHTVIS